MRVLARYAVPAAVASLLAVPALADTPAAPPRVLPAPAEVVPVRRAPTPLATRVAAAIDRQRLALADLDTRLRAATDEPAARAIVRQIEQVKRDTEVEVLRAQVEHARQAGRPDVARLLEAAIAARLAPPDAGTPVSRPAPPAAR